jgi:hypothetical protein
VLSTPPSPGQRAYVERVIGSIRREGLDPRIVLDEGSLRPILASYFHSYHRSRTHLSLSKDSPQPRPIQPPEIGPLVAIPQVGDCTPATNDAPPETARIHVQSLLGRCLDLISRQSERSAQFQLRECSDGSLRTALGDRESSETQQQQRCLASPRRSTG